MTAGIGWPGQILNASWDNTHVKAFTTLRSDGQADLNFGLRCGADVDLANQHRARLAESIGRPIQWLSQVHGHHVLDVSHSVVSDPVADAAVTDVKGVALAVLTADCLPVLFASMNGMVIGAAHAGWRGLLAGVLENTVRAMLVKQPDAHIRAWIGPSIRQSHFEVGEEVRQAFIQGIAASESAFIPGRTPGKWQCDLAAIARERLVNAGVSQVVDSGLCTAAREQDFYSFRRDKDAPDKGGRMASLIYLS